ncbi:MAG: hypothetical protein N4J56_007374 [Chroococcidiopsis sp. SAG 2025]|uniref:hypothetical protein n=1 Tax=Chroococcidiopsis sp. SAG 2025 TaxID=171389 RepID=UPI0029372D80|nr:hypothetical protein [Chroococcidiopsis sp. SAG 2025]MDV2997669.1 hypothetical protein [Chroococcidiopsis sp. SAG 2025]
MSDSSQTTLIDIAYQLGQITQQIAQNNTQVNNRFDRLEERIEKIESRIESSEAKLAEEVKCGENDYNREIIKTKLSLTFFVAAMLLSSLIRALIL